MPVCSKNARTEQHVKIAGDMGHMGAPADIKQLHMSPPRSLELHPGPNAERRVGEELGRRVGVRYSETARVCQGSGSHLSRAQFCFTLRLE